MEKPLRILHLEDEPKEVKLANFALFSQGIICESLQVKTQAEFASALEKGGIDLILADYALPSFDGLSALRFVKEKYLEYLDIPFILLSGVPGEEIAIEALKKGATDYVLKWSLSRLAPAVFRALREAEERRTRKQMVTS
ncbi:MAG: response regulator [Deltaproteobacteria bacterium]|nr:response regulator [Deltaproteobacteria bacterium]